MSHSPSPAASHIARSAGLIGVATMASRILGLVRDQVLAYLFGAGNAMDAFLIAFRIPNLLRDLFAEGAMSAAFVPTFTRCLTLRGKPQAWRLGNNVISALTVITAVLALSGILFASPLVNLYAGDYAQVPGKLDLTIMLTRVMFPFLSLVAIAAAFMGMLNSLHRFFVPALSSAMFNVGTILCAFALVPLMPWFGLPPITAIAIGTLVGGFGQIAVQWPVLRREGYRYRPVFDPRDEDMRQVAVLMGPGIMGLAAVQINLFVNSWLATSQGTGAVSWLNYAFRLMYLPIGLFGVSIATAALPGISGHAARGDLAGMRRTVSSSLRMMFMLNVPATAGLVALAAPIVGLIFEHGRFSPADTAATASALAFYAPGLVGYSAVKLISPAFYALRDSRTPVLISAASVLTNVILNIALVHTIGYRGLALGTAVAALFNAGALLWLLRKRLGGVEGGRLLTAFLKIAVASVVMAVAAFEAERLLHLLVPGRSILAGAARVFTAIGIGLLVLAVSAMALRIGEFAEAVRVVRQRLRRTPVDL
jgi:putative peptidoglycan lipid II flippase